MIENKALQVFLVHLFKEFLKEHEVLLNILDILTYVPFPPLQTKVTQEDYLIKRNDRVDYPIVFLLLFFTL